MRALPLQTPKSSFRHTGKVLLCETEDASDPYEKERTSQTHINNTIIEGEGSKLRESPLQIGDLTM